MASSIDESQLPNIFKDISNLTHEIADEDYFRYTASTCHHIIQRISSGSDRCQFDGDFARSVERVLLNSLKPSPECDRKTVAQYVTDCFRVLRNLCAMCPENQDVLNSSSSMIDTTCLVINHTLETVIGDEESVVLKRCAVQFLGNYASGKQNNQLEIWQKLQSIFLQLLLTEDQKLHEYIMIVLHICLGDLAACLETPPADDPSWQLISAVIQCVLEQDSANGLIVVEDFLKIKGFCENVFQYLNCSSRLLVLEVLINSLKRLPEDAEGSVDEIKDDRPAVQNLQFVAADFILQSHLIPQMMENEDKALCTVKELECLCLASAHHSKYGVLQENPKLVTATVVLLQAIQELGRQGHHVFANVEKMSRQHEVDPDHPVFGLKRDLIRLLGNLAYRHRENQDLVRKLEGLPLIMEQTNIDDKNPFITQWSVFALHNLTEDNEENRLYIANLKLEGIANNQAVLDEMGLAAEQEGEKVVIKKRKTE